MNRPLGILKLTTPSDREILLTRDFDAPRKLVFDALNAPKLLRRWLLGPPGWSMLACEIKAVTGGRYRHVWRNASGDEMAMHGVYHEVTAPERIVRTESCDFGGEPHSGEQVATLVLIEKAGKTTLALTLLYPSKVVRDAAIAACIELGVSASYDRLALLLESAPAEAIC